MSTELPWFRFYHQFIDDPIVRLLAFEDQRHFVFVLCMKAKGDLDKLYPSDQVRDKVICAQLGLTPIFAEEAKRRLMDVGLIDASWQPLGWEKRQMRSDSSAERVKRYRDRREANGLSRSTDLYDAYAEVFGRDGGKCVYCESTENLCLDHMRPIQLGGTDDPDNLAIACRRCNSGKSGRTPGQAGMAIVGAKAKLAWARYCNRYSHALDREEEEEEEREIPPTRPSDGFPPAPPPNASESNGTMDQPLTDASEPDGVTGSSLPDASEPKGTPGKGKRSDRATRIPEEFALTPARRAVAEAENLPNVERVFAKFLDHWRAKAGAAGRKVDWDATWRNWCREEADRARPVQRQRGGIAPGSATWRPS